MERFTSKDYINYVLESKNVKLEDIKVGEVVILSWFNNVIDYLKDKYNGVNPSYNTFGKRHEIYNINVNGKLVTLFYSSIGAPATIAAMEELRELGGKVFIGIGLAGSLNENLKLGDLLIPYESIREEGTSYHYLDHKDNVYPCEELKCKMENSLKIIGYKYIVGSQWTTDAIYKETLDQIEKYSKLGVYGVDMETSAMYAFGQATNTKVCNILAISDELWHKWNPGFGGEIVLGGLEKATKVVEELIKKL
ncbi:nucleoside phosphorylase [Clostridium sp. CTA-19]